MNGRSVAAFVVLVMVSVVACAAHGESSDVPSWRDHTGEGVWQSDDVSASTGAPPRHAERPWPGMRSRRRARSTSSTSERRIGTCWSCGGTSTVGISPISPSPRAGVPVADQSAVYGYAFDGQMTEHIIFVGVDGHLHEMWSDAGQWHSGDLTLATGTVPPALGPGSISGYVAAASGSQHVVFVGVDGHIYELAYGQTGWYATDLTDLTKSPSPAPTGELRRTPSRVRELGTLSLPVSMVVCTSCGRVVPGGNPVISAVPPTRRVRRVLREISPPTPPRPPEPSTSCSPPWTGACWNCGRGGAPPAGTSPT